MSGRWVSDKEYWEDPPLTGQAGLQLADAREKHAAHVKRFAEELRKWWSFDDDQQHTHSWHTREDFIKDKLPELLKWNGFDVGYNAPTAAVGTRAYSGTSASTAIVRLGTHGTDAANLKIEETMGVWRPYEAKRRLRDALARGYWHEPGDMSREDRQNAERSYVHMRIKWPWSKERRNPR